jgi:hypothetical protein
MGLLIEVAIVACAIWLAWRGFRQQQRNVADAVRGAEQAVKDAAPQTLVKDPATGVYRPIDRPK